MKKKNEDDRKARRMWEDWANAFFSPSVPVQLGARAHEVLASTAQGNLEPTYIVRPYSVLDRQAKELLFEPCALIRAIFDFSNISIFFESVKGGEWP